VVTRLDWRAAILGLAVRRGGDCDSALS